LTKSGKGKLIATRQPGEETHFCRNHPEEPATVQCKVCGAHLCYDCKCYHYGENYCESCFEALRRRDAANDWIYPAAATAVIAVSALLFLMTLLGVPGAPRLVTGGIEAVIASVAGIVLWHTADVVLIVCAIWAYGFRRWARKGLIVGGALSAGRAVFCAGALALSGNPLSLPLAVFYLFIIIYGLSIILFYSSKALRDEFRAVRP
jgi:hypothetical protein